MPPEDRHGFSGVDNLPTSNTAKEKQRRETGVELVHYDGLVLGRSLGRGCFADVHELLHFQPPSNEDTCCRDENNQVALSKYAIKCIRTDFQNPKTYRRAARDLETEVNLLAEVAHPHIIKIYAKSASGTDPSNCTEDTAHDFFIVMDRLSGTLTDRMSRWRLEKDQIKAAPVPLLFARSRNKTHNGGKQNELFLERLQTAHDVALALSYLHKNGIVYRDLKADNVGFDMDGKVKLFDFGLARRLPSDGEAQQVHHERCYRMTKLVGSLPHMAPEVWKGEPYNEKADVYSFAILLWVIMTLELPYIELAYDLEVLTQKVMINGYRPTLSSRWPKDLQKLLTKAWDKDMWERPSMETVREGIKGLIAPALPAKNSSGRNARATRKVLPKRSTFF